MEDANSILVISNCQVTIHASLSISTLLEVIIPSCNFSKCILILLENSTNLNEK